MERRTRATLRGEHVTTFDAVVNTTAINRLERLGSEMSVHWNALR